MCTWSRFITRICASTTKTRLFAWAGKDVTWVKKTLKNSILYKRECKCLPLKHQFTSCFIACWCVKTWRSFLNAHQQKKLWPTFQTSVNWQHLQSANVLWLNPFPPSIQRRNCTRDVTCSATHGSWTWPVGKSVTVNQTHETQISLLRWEDLLKHPLSRSESNPFWALALRQGECAPYSEWWLMEELLQVASRISYNYEFYSETRENCAIVCCMLKNDKASIRTDFKYTIWTDSKTAIWYSEEMSFTLITSSAIKMLLLCTLLSLLGFIHNT